MISWLWLLLVFPAGWFMFFLGVALSNSQRSDEEYEKQMSKSSWKSNER